MPGHTIDERRCLGVRQDRPGAFRLVPVVIPVQQADLRYLAVHQRAEVIAKIVVAMQFQDITRQKLEHVGQALDQFKRHLQILQKGPLTEETAQELAGLERIEENYTMEAERRLHQAALQPQYQEPVPLEASDNDEDSVTLF